MFPLLIQNFLSHGSSRIITTLARLHFACTEIPHEVSPLMIPSGELWPTLFVPQRMKIQDKVEFERNFRFFILHTKFWILSPEMPKFNALCLEKYSDQTSIKYLKANHLVKNLVLKIFHTNQAYCSMVLGKSGLIFPFRILII